LEFRISDRSTYVVGIGVVERKLEVFAAGDNINALRTVDMNWVGMDGLPEPVIYKLEQGQPVMLGADVTLRVDGQQPFSPADYEILNASALENISWLSVEANNSETAYIVSMSSQGIPSQTASRTAYLRQAGSTQQIPVNITISAN
jgi:hypothetical protein